MKHLGLFEGIGGFSLAARWMGWETLAWCEWNEFGQKVLKHHFPEAEGFGDITKTDFTKYANTIDILTGGFPCQPYSQAGKRKGKEDERHLWPEMLRAIREVQPRWVVGENVLGLVNWNGGLVFHEVQTDLEAEGYEVWPYVLPACAVNAPHRRDRVWFIAYSNGSRNNNTNRTTSNYRQYASSQQTGNRRASEVTGFSNEWNVAYPNSDGCQRSNSEHEKHSSEGREYALGNIEQVGEYASNTTTTGLQRRQGKRNTTDRERERSKEKQRFGCDFGNVRNNWQNFPTQSPICDGNDGFPSRLDTISFPKWRNESIKAGGNAIVPEVAYQIFKTIEAFEANINQQKQAA